MGFRIAHECIYMKAVRVHFSPTSNCDISINMQFNHSHCQTRYVLMLFFFEEWVVFDSRNREAVMKGEALRSASLDHSLSPVLWGPLSSCILQSCREHKANSHTREETCRSDAEMWGKITFPGRKECKSAFWREVAGQFGIGRTYIYYPCVCLCVSR